jgi:hypothetical protein
MQMDIGDPPSRAAGPLGHTVAEVHARSKALAGKKVSVRAVVVKVNENIMGRNWLHLQDGSGDPAAGTHDLAVTTRGKAKMGQRVLVRGRLVVDRDFGAGYSYPVIIEDGELLK